MISFKCAEPAPPCSRVVGCCVLLCTPIDGIWSVVAIERPDVGGKGGGIHVEIGDSSHVGACSCYTVPVHYITIYALIWHWTVGLVPAITECYSPFSQFFV